jgi:phosphocarrier protein HPr
MLEREITLKNKTGLHARPATDFVKYANSFKSDISIVYKDSIIDAKSIVALLTGGLCSGATFMLKTEGDDEQEAMDQITSFFEKLTD